MIDLLTRAFIVDVPVDQAWDHLARVEQWPSWAKHIKRVTLEPNGPLTPSSTGTVAADGPGTATLGRLFGAIYARNLDRAIPNLQAELRSCT